MSSSAAVDVSPTGASEEINTSMEDEDLDAVSTTATEGKGIIGELVDDGILVPCLWDEEINYFCSMCELWYNGHSQAVVHLFGTKHARCYHARPASMEAPR